MISNGARFDLYNNAVIDLGRHIRTLFVMSLQNHEQHLRRRRRACAAHLSSLG
jgi:hypothetical protein